jgi:hypothetical protein
MDDAAPRRARSMAEMAELNGRLGGLDDIVAAIKAYRPRPSDVIITPFGKCGTTWLQQTFHCLRTRGDMDFDDISRVVPWIETARMVDIDLEAPQRAEPRGFKSHLSYTRVPKGARYIVSLRDPRDAMVSMYRFMEGWFLEPGAVSIDEFARARMQDRGDGSDYWTHLISWWEQRDNPDVLVLSYEYMTAEPKAAIRKVAAFSGLPLDDELLALTLDHTSLAFMLEHKDRFDDRMMRDASEAKGGLPPGSDSSKVRKGGVGGYRQELSEAMIAALDAKWAATVTPALGFASYAELEAELRGRLAN